MSYLCVKDILRCSLDIHSERLTKTKENTDEDLSCYFKSLAHLFIKLFKLEGNLKKFLLKVIPNKK